LKPVDYIAIATKYAKQVVAGKIVAGMFTRQACQRQLDDLQRAKKKWPYRFDSKAAARPCRFLEKLPHVKGKWAKDRKRLKLEPWQCFWITTSFGWLRKSDSTRRYRTLYMEVARKNAKSTIASGLALYMLALDGEAGAECYSAATKKDQARIVFDAARKMALACPRYLKKYNVQVLAHALTQESTGSKFVAIDAEARTQDGLNPHCTIYDELHAARDRALFDVMDSATGSREQPLMIIITTAGSDQAGVCYEQRNYTVKILSGVFADETFFGIIYTIDDSDDWADEKCWPKANPNLGVSVSIEDMRGRARKARQSPASLNAFKTKKLDVWVSADSAWMDMGEWNAAGDPSLVEDDFALDECVAGLDLASKIDIAARVNIYRRTIKEKAHYFAFGKFYLPESVIEGGGNDHYTGWHDQGFLTSTPGNVIDFDEIEDDIIILPSVINLREVAYDPHQATQMISHLVAEAIVCVEMRPTVLNFSEPMKEIQALVKVGRFHHTGDPVLAWMVSNVVCHTDKKDNIYPNKARAENKIDGVVAMIMAIGRLILDEESDDMDAIIKARGGMAA
jgi:phage terminase large subunit-like protein